MRGRAWLNDQGSLPLQIDRADTYIAMAFELGLEERCRKSFALGASNMFNTRHTHELELAITRYMADHGVDRTEAVRRILSAWFCENGYLKPTELTADTSRQ